MNKQNIRAFLLGAVLFFGGMLCYKYIGSLSFAQPERGRLSTETVEEQGINNQDTTEIPSMSVVEEAPAPLTLHKRPPAQGIVTIDTNTLKVTINAYGDIVLVELKKYPQNTKSHGQGFQLIDNSNSRFYIAQTGLLSGGGPDSKTLGRAKFVSKEHNYDLSGQEEGFVDLVYAPDQGQQQANKDIKFIKRFYFNNNSYLIKIDYIVINNSDSEYKASLYGRLRRLTEETKSGFFSGGMRTYTGAAISTPNERYKKITFSDMKNPYKIAFSGGWIAMLEHYFVSAWVPNPQILTEYQTEDFKDGSFGIRFINAAVNVAPGQTKHISAQLFVGPKVAETLKKVSPALDLTVDYGVLWWISAPLFVLLKAIYHIVGNWGWAIIMTTLLIKLLFYRLSASSYKSMGNLRNLQPKIEELKTKYAQDRQKFSQAVIELYKKEKVNPLGGCLPILIQIPVFIALYYVLLESVELRQAPWCLWIADLSAKDPWFILPVIMGISMFAQQRLNPPPADPVQAKVLMFMPIFFTVLFLNFPAGLMLYWVVNNGLSILQQMYITRRICANR